MNKKRFARAMLFVIGFSLFAACSREEKPSVSAVGSWRGTLTVMKFPSPTVPFTAEITATNQAETEYRGVFTFGDTSHNVMGRFVGRDHGGESFVFEAPLSELHLMESPVTPSPLPSPGLMWSGLMTQNTFQGGEFQLMYEGAGVSEPLQIGEFSLERQP